MKFLFNDSFFYLHLLFPILLSTPATLCAVPCAQSKRDLQNRQKRDLQNRQKRPTKPANCRCPLRACVNEFSFQGFVLICIYCYNSLIYLRVSVRESSACACGFSCVLRMRLRVLFFVRVFLRVLFVFFSLINVYKKENCGSS